MKLASFRTANRDSYGAVTEDGVMEVSKAFRQKFANLQAVIDAGASREIGDNLEGARLRAGELEFLPPVTQPDKILCVGVNYRPHIAEMGREVPEYPVVFVRFPGSLVGHETPILRPEISEQFDFEGELAVVIGKRARHVPREHALEYVGGYCCFMDGSVRDWQRHTMQFTPGKNFDKSGAIGPCIVTGDSIPDPSKLELITRVNGEVMQQGRVDELVFDIPALIEYCSTFAELLPGDIIATGTPGGVGAARTPPAWLRDGDVIEVDIAGIGVLRSPVRDAPAANGA